MKLRFAIATAAVVVLSAAPSAFAKGTAYVVGGNAAGEAAPQSIGPEGGLTPLTKSPTGGTPRSVAITPNAQFLYTAFLGAGNPGISGFSIGASGTLTPIAGVSPLALTAGTMPEGVAISPNGQTLYVAQQGANSIAAFTIGTDGTLTANGTAPAPGFTQGAIAVAPNGQHLYATTNTGVLSFSIGANGALTSLGGPFAAGTTPKGIALAPSGRFLYVGNTGSNNLTAFSVAADGSLTSLGNSPAPNTPNTVAVSSTGSFVVTAIPATDNAVAYPVATDGSLGTGQAVATGGDEPFGVDVSPGATQVYVTNRVTANISAFSAAANGALTALTGSPFAAGVVNPEFQSIAITPNQGPTSLFTATPQGVGNETLFSGAPSSDSDGGTVARYDWDFGDGTTLPNGGPTPTHVYTQAGDYQVSLLVTDDEGCSSTVIHTGQTADCNGGAKAISTQTVPISGSASAPDLKLSGKTKQKLGKVVKVKAVTGVDTDAVAKGKLKTEGPKKGKIALGSFTLKQATATIAANSNTTLKLKVPSKAQKKGKKALKKGGKVTAKINVKVTDPNDLDTDKESIKVKLKK